jgi:hypothetical protein
VVLQNLFSNSDDVFDEFLLLDQAVFMRGTHNAEIEIEIREVPASNGRGQLCRDRLAFLPFLLPAAAASSKKGLHVLHVSDLLFIARGQ